MRGGCSHHGIVGEAEKGECDDKGDNNQKNRLQEFFHGSHGKSFRSSVQSNSTTMNKTLYPGMEEEIHLKKASPHSGSFLNNSACNLTISPILKPDF